MSGRTHFEIYRDRRGEWRWRFRAANGRIVATSSEGYADRMGARDGIHLLKSHNFDTPLEWLERQAP